MIDQILKNLIWLGHDGFCLKAVNKTIYIDPFQISGDFEPADIILVTHEHYDHCSPADIEKLVKADTIIITDPMSARKLKGDIRIMRPGDNMLVEGIMVEAVPAYNTNKKFHPKANKWLGFVITVDGVKIYHAGDTDHIPEMKKLEVDIALLPVSGTYVMTANEAVQAALDINPKVAIPMHYGSLVGTPQDGPEFECVLSGKLRVELLKAKK